MKTTFIQNGKLSLVLTPENDIDKVLLSDLFKTSVDATQVSTMQIGDINHVNCVIITPSKLPVS